jgi:FKBP-type peptidyl-prolyl cis-trans isomerase
MKILNYLLIICFSFLIACNNEVQEDTPVKKEKINPYDLEKLAQIDKKIIREYVNLQPDMTFDSTDSGIFYHIENPGIGDPPTDSSTVTVNYTLYLVDGTLVESTEIKGKPSTFKVSKVIDGWQESLKLLGVTGKGTFVIPSGLGYGLRRVNGMPHNAILVFDIEILTIVD